MDDISWPPKKQPTLKIVPGPRSRPRIRYEDDSPEGEDVQPTDSRTQGAADAPASQAAKVDSPETSEAVTRPNLPSTHQTLSTSRPTPKTTTPQAGGTGGGKKKRLYFKRIHLSKKKWALLITLLLLVMGGSGVGAWQIYKKVSYTAPLASVPKIPEVKPPPPTTEPSRLTGLDVEIALNARPVTAVMIENSPDARPQSGLKDAGIVYEAVAEGGITRFIALYQAERPGKIGPVRSIRPYYIDFAYPFEAGIAHVGGSPQGLADIKSLGARDLDQFANAEAFERVKDRFAPHNVYTNFDKLDALNAKRGYTSSSFTSFSRKKETPAGTPTAKAINLTISSSLYNVRYDYDSGTNAYLRSEGGAPHMDANSGTQLSPKVVVALVMSKGIDADGTHTKYGTTGSGKMIVFQDGTFTEGVWSKADRKAQFVFTDAAGGPLGFNPGQTWFTIIDDGAKATYTP